MDHRYGKVHQTAFAPLAGFIGAFVRVFVNKMSVLEVKSVLLQIGLPFCLIPYEHNLIVATIN